MQGLLVWRNYKSSISGEQTEKFRQEICWAFQHFYLDMGISPRQPRFIYVRGFGPPFHLNPKRNAGTLRRLIGQTLIVASSMMRLTVTGQMVNM